jgi:hypothetical protein
LCSGYEQLHETNELLCKARSQLVRSFGGERFYYGKLLEQLRWEVVSFLQINWTVVW